VFLKPTDGSTNLETSSAELLDNRVSRDHG
jgi:hypothetical protein